MEQIRNILEYDSKFLSKYDIMDYSLLLVIEYVPSGFGG